MFERLTPPEDRVPICPVCGEQCETIVKNINREVIGCDNCLGIQDAWFYLEEEMEQEELDQERYRMEAFA